MFSIQNCKNNLVAINNITYHWSQENGQRKCGPPVDYFGAEPSRGCEIFVGKLPQDCYEEEIMNIFLKIGKIYQLRLMVDFGGKTRGFCFIKFFRFEDAKRSKWLMDNWEIRPGRHIGVSLSFDNCRLYIAGINVNKTAEEVETELKKMVNGIQSVIMYSSQVDKTKNRGFVFVEFESHRLAAKARKQFCPGPCYLWNQKLVVDWAEPEAVIDPKIMERIRKLFIRNLNGSTTEQQILEVLCQFTHPNNILRVKKIKDCAFVHFRTRGSAELCLAQLKNLHLDGCKLDVTWAKPPQYSKVNDTVFDQENIQICKSLPPRLRNKNKTYSNSSDSKSIETGSIHTLSDFDEPNVLMKNCDFFGDVSSKMKNVNNFILNENIPPCVSQLQNSQVFQPNIKSYFEKNKSYLNNNLLLNNRPESNLYSRQILTEINNCQFNFGWKF